MECGAVVERGSVCIIGLLVNDRVRYVSGNPENWQFSMVLRGFNINASDKLYIMITLTYPSM